MSIVKRLLEQKNRDLLNENRLIERKVIAYINFLGVETQAELIDISIALNDVIDAISAYNISTEPSITKKTYKERDKR